MPKYSKNQDKEKAKQQGCHVPHTRPQEEQLWGSGGGSARPKQKGPGGNQAAPSRLGPTGTTLLPARASRKLFI